MLRSDTADNIELRRCIILMFDDILEDLSKE